MVTVSSITINTGRYAMIHLAFFIYIPVNFAFNLPHYVTSYMHQTGNKESKKEKEKINKVTKNLLLWEIEPRPSEYVRTENEQPYPVDHLGKSWHVKIKRSIYSLSMVIDSFQGWWWWSKPEVNLTINPLTLFQASSMPGNLCEIYEQSISRLPTEQYDCTILSLLVRCLFIGRGKH